MSNTLPWHEIHQIDRYQIRTINIKSRLFFKYPFLISALSFAVIILLSVFWLRLWSVDDISGIVVIIWTQCSRFLGSPSFINEVDSKKPANRLKLRPQYIDFSCLNPVWKMRLYPSVILITYQIYRGILCRSDKLQVSAISRCRACRIFSSILITIRL